MLFRVVISLLMLCSGSARAACDWAEQAEQSGRSNIALMQYMYCAEEENDAEAQYKLGALFYKGQGLAKPDYRRAAVYFALAARNGYAPAQVKLGLLYWRGEGLQKSLKMAHKWLYLAQEPANLRWFYPFGKSTDPVAEQVFAKIKNVAVYEDVPAGIFRKVPVSYSEVATFQHEKLLEAGKKYLSERDQGFLKAFLDNLKPDVDLPAAEKKLAESLLKPAMLTVNNFTVKKTPVLEKLNTTISAAAAAKPVL